MKTVLTVDDSKVVRTMVARHLRDLNVTLVEATNGQEGVLVARQHAPDLILLDVTMPVMDGRQALTELRKDPMTKDVPVIMLTAESGRDLVMDIARLGVAGYIVKPFQKDHFVSEVKKVLGSEEDAPVDRSAVLVVDDSERVLAAAREALQDSMTVLTAMSGAEALERYREKRPGVVIIDLAMPQMDGFETCTEIQKLGGSACVALAVRGDGTAKVKAKTAGFSAVIDKPFQGADLVKQVQRARLASATPDELLCEIYTEENGCAVFTLPDAESKTLARVVPAFSRKLKSLAEDGLDRLVVDLVEVSGITAEQVASLARVLNEAQALGMRTAISAPDESVVHSLREIAETRDTPCATSRQAAVEQLL